MDRFDLILNNRLPKRLLLSALLSITVGAVIAWFLSAYCADQIMTEQIRRMFAVLGDGSFTKLPTEAAISKGSEAAAQYGISADMSPRMMQGWDTIRLQLFFMILLVVIVSVLLLLSAAMHGALRECMLMEQIRSSCLAIASMKAKRSPTVSDPHQSIERLNESINAIADRLQHLDDTAKKDKQFLVEFLTDFSHQLKTGLAVIRLNTDLLEEPSMLTSQQHSQLTEELSVQLDQMELLVRSSLKLAKLNADAVSYQMASADLSKTCEAAVQSVAAMLRQKQIALTFTPLSIPLSHDAIWLREAVENLMTNAAEHADCTAMKLWLYEDPVLVKIVVEDNGKGIPQSEIPTIFERFHKKSNSNTMDSVGIGLSISKKIVEGHGGHILVYSDLQKGTSFEIIFMKSSRSVTLA